MQININFYCHFPLTTEKTFIKMRDIFLNTSRGFVKHANIINYLFKKQMKAYESLDACF